MNTLQWVLVPDATFQGWPIYRNTLDGSLAYEADGERLVTLPTRYVADLLPVGPVSRWGDAGLKALSEVPGFEGLKEILG